MKGVKIYAMAIGIASIILLGSFAIWLYSNRVPENSETKVEYLRMDISAGYVYRGKSIFLETSITSWNDKALVYSPTFYTTKDSVPSIASIFGIKSQEVRDYYNKGWIVDDGKSFLTIWTTERGKGYLISFVSDKNESPTEENAFISDTDAVNRARDFLLNTVAFTIPNLWQHLKIKYHTIGLDEMTVGNTTWIRAKTVFYKIFYDENELNMRISVKLNSAGEVLGCSYPADFTLTPMRTINLGNPNDVLNFYKTNGIPVTKNPELVKTVIIKDIWCAYALYQSENGVLMVPYIYTKYKISYIDGSVEEMTDGISVRM